MPSASSDRLVLPWLSTDVRGRGHAGGGDRQLPPLREYLISDRQLLARGLSGGGHLLRLDLKARLRPAGCRLIGIKAAKFGRAFASR
jgi:hypothetical protein